MWRAEHNSGDDPTAEPRVYPVTVRNPRKYVNPVIVTDQTRGRPPSIFALCLDRDTAVRAVKERRDAYASGRPDNPNRINAPGTTKPPPGRGGP